MYELIIVPELFNEDIYSLNKEDAKKYFNWIQSIKIERMKVLEKHVKSKFPNWKPDHSKESLVDLYSWFETTISLKPISQEEIEKIKHQIAKTPQFINIIPIPEFEFTPETISICFDISVYFGETIINCVPDVKWGQKINSINFIDYAYPLLMSKKYKVPTNPRRILEVLANDILYKENNTRSFIEVFDKCEKQFSGLID